AAFEGEVAENIVAAFGQRGQHDLKGVVLFANGMQVREGVAAALAHEEQVHQFAVIGDERDVVVVPEKFFADFELQDAIGAFGVKGGCEVRPGAFAEVILKTALFGCPPIFSDVESTDKNNGGRGGGEEAFPAVTTSGGCVGGQGGFASGGCGD